MEVRYCPNKEAIHRPLGGLWTLDADKNHLNVATIHKSTVKTRTDNRNDKKRIFFRCIWNICHCIFAGQVKSSLDFLQTFSS